MFLNKKGKLEWEYLAAIVLVLLIVVVLLITSTGIRDMILDRLKEIFSKIIPDWLGQ